MIDWATAWSSHDPEQVTDLVTDDCVYEDVTLGVTNHGKAELRAFAEELFKAFPDVKVELTSRFAGGDWGGMEWTMSGTHRGDLPGLPATGKPFSFRGASIVVLQKYKIRRCADYWDLATFLKQVGKMPTG